MGVRQERREKRVKAEEEIKKAFLTIFDYMEEHPLRFGGEIRLIDLAKMVENRLSADTRLRYKDIVTYYLTKARNLVLETERKERSKIIG